MKLSIVLKEGDLDVISRLKKSLSKKFNPNSENDIEKGIELANYLIALEEFEQAKLLLDSFFYTEPTERPEHLWVTNAQGLVLLVYLAKLENQKDLYLELKNILENNGIWPLDIGLTRWIKMHISDHEKKMKYSLTETKKYRCSIIGQEVLSFLYFNEILYEGKKVAWKDKMIKNDVKKILENSKKSLVDSLNLQ